MVKQQPLYSILITSYECEGMGPLYIKWNLERILKQTYRRIQIVVSDHSKNDEIADVIKALDFKDIECIYVKCTENYGNPSTNWNNALKYAKGDYIHYFAMDDYLFDENSVANIVNHMDANRASKWCISASILTTGKYYYPQWNNDILTNNTVGGPSTVTIRSEISHIKLDPEFTWLLDVDWYYRVWLEAGEPSVLDTIIWVNRINPYQLTNTYCNDEIRAQEEAKIRIKYSLTSSP